jgi:MEMO1 family protein
MVVTVRSRTRWLAVVVCVAAGLASARAQIPMESVLKRVTVASTADTRGLVDIVGFAHTPEQMTFVGDLCERLEQSEIAENQKHYGFDQQTGLSAAWCPHDDYALAGRIYVHVARCMKARTIILIGNSHWSETFGVRNKLIFDDFAYWRGPYAPVRVSGVRAEILKRLDPNAVLVSRKIMETEHSLEALIPFLQYYDRDVEIVPILVPLMSWDEITGKGQELARAVTAVMKEHGWKLGRDVAVLCSGDGQHYGDYGWSYYDYYPFGCDADGYKQALEYDYLLTRQYLEGELQAERLRMLFGELVEQDDISKYRVTWCGRFAVPFGLNFARLLAGEAEGRPLTGYTLRRGSSLALPWLSLESHKMGLTGDANLHHFVTYVAIGFK